MRSSSSSSQPARAIPRRWNVEVDGIRWLPRLIDKARMQRAGTLGTYLMGHSPVDHALLTRLHIGTEAFVALVHEHASDEAVLAALRTRGFDEARVRRWSERFPRTYSWYIVLWDLDEGYRTPTLWERAGLAVFRFVEGAAMALVRAVRRAP